VAAVAAVAPTTSTGAAGARPGTALGLVSQTAAVTPGGSLDLKLGIAAPGHDPAHLGLTVAVYPCLSSVSGFDQSIGPSGPGNPSTSTHQPLPVADLPSSGGVVDLSMPVVVRGAPVAGAPFTIDLVPANGECQAFPSGVFPVRVQLVDTASSAVLGSFVTHLVFSETPASQKLRVSVVLPLQLALGAAPAPAAELAVHPSAALATPTAPSLAALTGTVAAVARHSGVPVTLSVSGQALQALATAGRDTSIDQLSSLAVDVPDHQMLFAPYVPVDATALVGAGLTAELGLQVARGAQVSAPVTHQSPAPQPAGGLGTWMAGGTLDGDTVAVLRSAGFHQVVMAPTAVSKAPTNGSAAMPFTVAGARSTELAGVASNTDLTARVAGSATDPVLAAHQLAAELAQIFYEQPNATAARGVVVLPPPGWQTSPAFVDALLGSLENNPLLEGVTVNGLFASVAPSIACRLDCRLSGGAPGPLPAAAVRLQRRRVNGFAAATSGSTARGVATQLSDLVLAGQSDLLRAAQQASVEASAGRAIDAQLQRLEVGGGQVTLTSQQGTLPVTITSSAPFVVQATMTLTSDKLVFPNGTTQWTRPGVVTVLPSPHTTVVDVPVRTRGSGLFPVEVVLRSPSGGLQLATGTIDIRSAAASVVGIALSVGAVVVLAAWWFRTSRRRRAARRREEADEQPRVPVGVP
jgi:hypothetical protein